MGRRPFAEHPLLFRGRIVEKRLPRLRRGFFRRMIPFHRREGILHHRLLMEEEGIFRRERLLRIFGRRGLPPFSAFGCPQWIFERGVQRTFDVGFRHRFA